MGLVQLALERPLGRALAHAADEIGGGGNEKDEQGNEERAADRPDKDQR